MAIFATGDTHGSQKHGFFSFDGFMHRLSTESFFEQKDMTKDDFIVICGDFGGIWDYAGESKEEKYALDWLESKSFTTLFVPGNHENYDRLTGISDQKLIDSWLFERLSKEKKQKLITGYPQKAWHGGMVREIRPSVLMLERGYVFDLCGKKCFAFGGAKSHDISDGILCPENFDNKKDFDKEYKKNWQNIKRMFRVNHVSWWEQEMPNEMEMERGLAMLEDEGNSVDFIFTHDAPASDKAMIIGKSPDNLNQYFEKIKNTVQYKKWCFGHMHGNVTVPGGKDILLYEQIIRLD